jgi:histidinol-phosphate aminotransferase
MLQLSAGLDKIGAKFVPSFGNFIYIEAGVRASEVARELEKLGVIVRPLDWMGMPDGLRVTVGTSDENEKFLTAYAKIVNAHKSS